MSESGIGPLSGMRVLDLSSDIAGPYATKLLVDAGAEVIKVESPGGDPLRKWSTSGQDLSGRDGALFQFLNGGKKSVVWDLETATGRDRCLQLAQTIDLVVEDLGAKGLSGLDLGFDQLQARNPALSVLSISPYGLEGPWAEKPANEFTLQAEIGSTGYRGLPERGPLAAAGRIGEWAAGSCAVVGGLAAWLSARRSGCGQHVDLSMFESMATTMTTYFDIFGQVLDIPLVQAIETPSIEPAKDGWVGLCTYTGQQWKDLCTLMGHPEVGEDDRFYDARVRMEHLEYIHGVIHGWTREHTIDEIIELVTLMRIPCSPVGDGRTVLEFDHFVERGVFQDHPDGFKAPRVPYQISGMTLPPMRSAPRLGEHTSEIDASLPRAKADVVGGAVSEDSIPLPFEGLRIVDLTAFWAGPIVTSTLAALGADVVKVESIQRPDGMRFAGARPGEKMWEFSPVFHGCNQSKREITLDLDQEEGKAILRRLLEGADVVIENFSARVMQNFGFTWDVLHEINPRLISVRMPAWGLDGPWRDRTGFAPNVEQASGLAWITGYEDLPLIPRGVCDPIGGMHTVFALAMGLEERERTGEGMLVEIPLVEPALNVAAEQVIEWTAYGELLGRTENRGPGACPRAVFACEQSKSETRVERDQIALSISTDEEWRRLVDALGRPEWATQAELASEEGRRAAEDRIEAELARWFATRECDEVVESLLAAGITIAPLVNGHYIWPNPQLEARGFFQIFEHPEAGPLRYPDLPFRFSSRPGGLHRTPPPTLGQHNEEILCGELGLSKAELAALREKKVVGEAPAFEIG